MNDSEKKGTAGPKVPPADECWLCFGRAIVWVAWIPPWLRSVEKPLLAYCGRCAMADLRAEGFE